MMACEILEIYYDLHMKYLINIMMACEILVKRYDGWNLCKQYSKFAVFIVGQGQDCNQSVIAG